MNIIKLSFLVLLLIIGLACTKAEEELPSPLTKNKEGTNLYENKYFGVSVEKPEGWYSQSAIETVLMQQRGSSAIAGEDENLKAIIDASMKTNMPIFGFFEFKPGTPGKLNPNVLCIAENIKPFPGIESGCDYISHVKDIISRGKLKYQFDKGCETKNIGGKELGFINASLNAGDQNITQTYHAFIQDGFAISIVQTYFNEESKKKVDEVLDTIRFDFK